MGRYDNLSFNNGEYIPQYAGLPLDEIQKSADVLAGRHYQNLASLNQLQLLREQYKSKLLPGASSYIDEQFQDIDAALQDIAKNGGENATARVGAITNRFLGDQGLLKGLQRAEEVRKEIELENDLIGKGQQPLRKKGLRESLTSTPIIDPVTGKLSQAYETPYQSTVTPYVDPTMDYKRLVDEIKPDQWISQGLRPENVVQFNNAKMKLESGEYDIPKFLSEATSAGVTPQKIQALKEKLFTAYKNTKSYQQQKDYLDKSDEDLQEDLYNYAQLGIYRRDDKKYHQITGSGGDGGKGKSKEPQFGEEALGSYSLGKVEFPSLMDKPVKKERPKVSAAQYSIPGSKQAVQNQNTGKAYTNAADDYWRRADEKYNEDLTEYNKQLKEFEKTVNTAATIFGRPNVNPESEEGKQLVKQLEEFTNERMENQAVNKYQTEQERVAVRNDLRANLYGRKVYDITEKEGNTYRDNNGDVRKEFLPLLQANENEFLVSGEANPLGPLAREAGPEFVNSHIVSVVDKETGKTRMYAISKSDGELKSRTAQRNDFSHQVYTAINSKPGQEVEIPISLYNGESRKPLTTIKAQEHIGGQINKFIEGIPDGEVVPVNGIPTKLKDLIKTATDNGAKLYTVVKPGDTQPTIYFSLKEMTDDFLPEKEQK